NQLLVDLSPETVSQASLFAASRGGCAADAQLECHCGQGDAALSTTLVLSQGRVRLSRQGMLARPAATDQAHGRPRGTAGGWAVPPGPASAVSEPAGAR